MVKVSGIGDGGEFACPHRGAVYAVTIHRFPEREVDSAKCDVCEEVMTEWNSTSAPSFKLKSTPK